MHMFLMLTPHGNHLCLGPAYMRSLFDLPFLEAFHKARVGLDAGPVFFYKGERELVRHAMVFDEIGDDDGSTT